MAHRCSEFLHYPPRLHLPRTSISTCWPLRFWLTKLLYFGLLSAAARRRLKCLPLRSPISLLTSRTDGLGTRSPVTVWRAGLLRSALRRHAFASTRFRCDRLVGTDCARFGSMAVELFDSPLRAVNNSNALQGQPEKGAVPFHSSQSTPKEKQPCGGFISSLRKTCSCDH
jgi:hypothetical protein